MATYLHRFDFMHVRRANDPEQQLAGMLPGRRREQRHA
jgi:hypothetical protein